MRGADSNAAVLSTIGKRNNGANVRPAIVAAGVIGKALLLIAGAICTTGTAGSKVS